VGAFREFKTIWDPEHKMNPGKVVEPYKNTENLRLGADYHPWTPVTVFQFPEDQGSLARASIRCVGVGACRQQKGGVMCPSYQATREEKHSTRGRARLLFEMLEGEVIPSTWRNEAVKDALDLCLACKGCKGECPVNVDMASYKAEFLHHYYKGRLRPRHAYAMGLIAPVSSWASRVPRIANFATQTPGLAAIAKFLAGIHPERSIPAFAEETFRHWYDARKPLSRAAEPRPQVVLWPDTFSNYFHPEVAKAALKVLEAVGYEVLIPRRQFCCGRPLYDFGFLPLAKKWLERILSGMRKEIRLGLPFVFLEPSCATVFRDELSNLLPHDLDATRLKKQAFLLSEFLAEKVPGFDWPKLAGSVLVQGHCHHRSVLKFESEHKLLERIADGVEMVSSSCCGMAGSFGFEKEHYELSQTLGAQALYPAVAKSGDETVILANGFSCREQIRQGTGRKATHLAQYLELALAAGHHTPRN
jgi:Fe-S oxidoreductase